MTKEIRILHLEDVKTDAEIVADKLSAKLSFQKHLVNTKNSFEEALVKFIPDVILCDHSLPAFNSLEALQMVRERGMKIPFILVTGTVSEEFAAKIIQQGADDYILKDRLERLPAAILNCLEKYNSEKKSKEMEERFSLTINSLKDYAIFQLDAEGNVISWNKAAEMIKGYQANQIIGKSMSTFYTEEDKAQGIPESNLRMAREHGRTETAGWRRRENGSLFFADVLITSLYDEYGNLKGYAKVIRDITERKHAEEKLRKSEADLLNIFNRSLDVICSTDEEGRFIKVSSAASSIWGYEPEELLGRKYMDLVYADDVQTTTKIAELISNGLDVNMFENRFVRKDGTTVPLQWSAHWDKREKIMYSVARDATEKKKAEQETLSLLNRLQSKNKDLRQFAYMVSHNLRAPIAKILGLASILQKSSDSAVILQKITEETINLDHVVVDMNSVITARDAASEKTENIVFSEELKLITCTLEQDLEESRAVVNTNFQVPGMLTVKGRFYNILYNLVSNAIKYRSPERPLQINIETSISDNHICLSVKDNGIGIDLNKHGEKIFMLYKRFHGDEIPGKGIGLNLVKVQVESLGGRVEVESTVDVGSVFKVHFPKKYKAKIRSQVESIFLIDDDKLCNAINKRVLLKQLSVSTITVYESALSAISVLEDLSAVPGAEFPDLIFLDIDMPIMDGWQFLEAFEKLPDVVLEKCTVIILTSSIDPVEIQRSEAFKTVHTFISKPLTQQKLLDLVS